MREEKIKEIKECFDELKTIYFSKKENNSFLSIESYNCFLNNGSK